MQYPSSDVLARRTIRFRLELRARMATADRAEFEARFDLYRPLLQVYLMGAVRTAVRTDGAVEVNLPRHLLTRSLILLAEFESIVREVCSSSDPCE